MEVAREELQNILKSIRGRRVERAELDTLVQKALDETKAKADGVLIPNTTWEYLLRTEVLSLAATEGQALQDPTSLATYYASLSLLLDLTLTFSEYGACEPSAPLSTCQDLLETQTISSCSHIFSWIQSRDGPLTKDLVPQKGKALVILRTLNELLRRLSKMGERNTEFCGRILIFLSQAFPLGERSGVNLRGEYGPPWDGPVAKPVKPKEEEGEDKNRMTVDESPEALEEAKKEDFYYTFWSLQQPFARPNVFADPAALPAFKESVNKVLPFIKEATAKERAMMGNKSASGNGNNLAQPAQTVVSAGSKRKRDAAEGVEESSSLKSYFFAKFLTSPDLLDLEIADTHFRRQFLFQLLTILQHLLTHTKAAKQAASKAGSKPLHIAEFTLEPTDAQWVQETQLKCIEELKQTAPNGRLFADSVASVLERERSWVRWKNEQCMPFDKEPWSEEIVVDIGDDEAGGEDEGEGKVTKKVGFEDATRKKRAEMMADPDEWEHKFGTAPLTEIWEMGYRDLTDLQRPFQPGEVKDFAKKIKMEDARINLRRQQLEKVAQQRARALAQAQQKAETETKDVKMSDATSEPTATTTTPTPPVIVQPVPTTSTPNTLHPSLPLKPGSSPVPAQAASPSPAPGPAAVAQVQVQPPARSTPPPPAPIQHTNLPPDSIIARHEESKHRWSWIALRTARDRYLQHFGKIGSGDIVQLEVEIEKEKKEREAEAAAAVKVDSAVQNGNGNDHEDHGVSGSLEVNGSGTARIETIAQADGDAKMEG